jgi:hypothetical protein
MTDTKTPRLAQTDAVILTVLAVVVLLAVIFPASRTWLFDHSRMITDAVAYVAADIAVAAASAPDFAFGWLS